MVYIFNFVVFVDDKDPQKFFTKKLDFSKFLQFYTTSTNATKSDKFRASTKLMLKLYT